MAETTTVRVQRSTHEQLRQAAEMSHVTFDALILDALEARRWRDYRRQADADAARLAGDPRERAWARQIRAEMDEMAAHDG